jgi:hypothetical protein
MSDEQDEVKLIEPLDDAQIRLSCFAAAAAQRPHDSPSTVLAAAKVLYDWVMNFEEESELAGSATEPECTRKH